MLHQPLNILQTCFSPSWGGLELQALEVSRKLRDRGHRVWLACSTGTRLAAEAEKHGLSVLPLGVTGYFHPLAVWTLRRLIRERGIDVIHCQHSRDIATVVPAMRLAGEPVPVLLSKMMGSSVNKKDFLHRFTYRHISRILAISSVIRRNVIETTPIPPDRVVTFHASVDTERYSLSRVNPNLVRREFGFDDETMLIGFVGRFSPGKGHEELLEAAHILGRKYGNIKFLIVGEASYGEQAYEQRITSLVRSMRLDRTVFFAGFREDIPDVMAAFDIFAFPSHAEAFGIALIEAMAMGRPVVSTNCDGVLDIVVEGVTGLYVPPRNGRALAEAIERLGNDPGLRRQLGKAGRQRVEQHFDQRGKISKLEEMYFELTGIPFTPRQPAREFDSQVTAQTEIR